MSTTKLTRKEISADPIHDALISTVEGLRNHAKVILWSAAGLAVVLLGIYFGLRYLDARDRSAQLELAKGMDFYHGSVDASTAKDDPYAAGPQPVFKSDEAKFRAASAIFSPLASRGGKIGVLARYYLGLCQKQLGQKTEAVATLQSVANTTTDRTVGYLAKKVLAAYYVELGEAQKGQEILQGMLKDAQCPLPKEDIQVDLARAYMAQGKRAEAIKVLQEAQDAGSGGMLQSMVFQELNRIQGNSGN